MLAEFVTWWTQQMRTLVPPALLSDRHGDVMVVRMVAGVLQAATRRRGREAPMGSLPPGSAAASRMAGRPVVLAVPPAALLKQRVSLPLAAERDVASVLRFEMDRLTPFQADALFWTWHVDRRDVAGGRLLLRLLLVPKATVAATLAAVAAIGARPVAIEVADGAATERLPIAPPGRRNAGLGGARGAAVACAVLLAALVAVPAIRQELAIAAVHRRIAALQPRMAAVTALRQRLAEGAGAAQLFAAEATRVGNPLQAIAALTAALPDDTWLDTLTMRERAVVITGHAASAAGLIASLSTRPDLKDPAFDAAVIRVADRTELFSIRVTAAP